MPWSRARRAQMAASAPPALSPPTPIFHVSRPSCSAFEVTHFVAVQASVVQPPAQPRAVFAPVPVIERAPRTFVVVSHGHDPPLVHALDSRPPPLFLS